MPDIFEEIVRIRRGHGLAALATVVEGDAGVPGKTGAKMLVYPDGKSLGTVGGGLFEAKILEGALRCLRDQKPRLLEFALDDEGAGGIGVLCGGKAKVYLEPIQGRPVLYVFGGGHIAVPLVQFANILGFFIVVVDDREDFASKERFPLADEVRVDDFVTATEAINFHEDDSVVVINRGHRHDEVVLQKCLSKIILPGYVGMIGSRAKVDSVFSYLKEQGMPAQLLATVKSPIGLKIGAQTPAEIALSIMAEIVKQRSEKLLSWHLQEEGPDEADDR